MSINGKFTKWPSKSLETGNFSKGDYLAQETSILPETQALTAAKMNRGKRAYLAGKSAEDAVERYYCAQGCMVAARRWRKGGGELDLVLRLGELLIFVEVKKSRDFAKAAEHLSQKQIERLLAGAAAFLSNEPLGELTDCRFDVALVNGQGEMHILENALAGY